MQKEDGGMKMYKLANGSSPVRISHIKPLQSQTRSFSHSLIKKRGVRRYLKGRYTCPQCGVLRRKVYRWHPFPLPEPYGKGQWYWGDCSCIKRQRDAQRKARSELLQAKIEDPLPPALQRHTFQNFKVASFNQEPYKICTAYVGKFAELTSGQGLVLTGKSGTGKTHLACAIANSLKDKYRVKFAYVPTLLERMRQGTVELEPLLNADLLILDDIGSERESAWTTERLLIIVDGRLTNCKPTIYTTNFETSDFDKRLGMRLASRVLGQNVALVLHGPDFRLQRYGY